MAESENNVEQEQEEFDCTVTVEDSGAWKKKIAVQVPRKEIDKELNNQYSELRKTADIPGFRKGHAPRKLFEKRFGHDVTNQAKLRLLAQALEKIDKDQDFEVLGEPDFDPEKIELPETGDLDFEYEIEVKPEFEIPTLEGVRIEKQVVKIDEKRVNEALEALRRRYGKMDEVETAQSGDMIRADVTMKVEGIEQGETGHDLPVRVGPTVVMGVWFEDMAKVLTGAKPGQTKTATAEVPDTHEKEEYRGKNAEFTIEIKLINRLIPAEMNEEFFGSFGVEDEETLRRVIQESLEGQVDREMRTHSVRQIYKYLEENVEFELPAGVAARYSDRMLSRRYYELLQQGVPQEQLVENMERLRASSSEQSAQELKMSFIMERVADKLEIEVSEMEINGYIANMAAQQGRRPERLRDELDRQGRSAMLKHQIREEKAIDRILEMADVVDAPAVKEEASKPKTRKKTAEKPAESTEKTKENAVENAAHKKTSRKDVKRKPPSADD